MNEAARETRYTQADERLLPRIRDDWGELVARHLHVADGLTLLAWQQEEIIGLLSLYWLELPAPIAGSLEAYIDIIEVRSGHRRQGVASRLVALAAQQAREHSAYQLRAWSSLDKLEAIPMWQRLGFGLCPTSTFPRGHEVKGYCVTLVL